MTLPPRTATQEQTARFQYDYHSGPGAHLYSPIFDFTFTQTTALSVASVSVTYEFDDEDWIDSGDAAGLLIMEECGDYLPSSAYSGDPDLNSIYYPAECTGTPLSAYLPPSSNTSCRCRTQVLITSGRC